MTRSQRTTRRGIHIILAKLGPAYPPRPRSASFPAALHVRGQLTCYAVAMPSVSHEELEAWILYEGQGLLVLNKPSDLPTSGRTLEDSDCLQSLLMKRQGAMVWAVHQLDADTSGLNLFVTEKHLVQDFKQRMTWPGCEKRYLAVVHGTPSWHELRVEEPIGRLPLSEPSSLGVCAEGRPSCTRLRVLAHSPGFALLEAVLETGRTHQIRIHAAHVGHPLVGEAWYRRPACLLHGRQALHAQRLRFASGPEPRSLEATAPQDFLQLCKRLALPIPGEPGRFRASRS